MKTSITVIFVLCCCLSALFAVSDAIVDPIRVYAVFHNLAPGRSVYKWEIDLNHDGQKEVLVATKLTPEELEEDERQSNWNPQTPNERDFTVYIHNPKGPGYFECKRADNETPVTAIMGVDIMHCFVGKITQIGKWGLVAVDIEPAGRRNLASATVYAYTVEGDHIRVTDLEKYDPDKEKSKIYEQYLSDSKRTKVELEELKL